RVKPVIATKFLWIVFCRASTFPRLKRLFRRPPRSSQQHRQLGDIRRDPTSLIARQQLARSSAARLIFAIDEGEGLPIVVTDNESRLGLFDYPWSREAAARH